MTTRLPDLLCAFNIDPDPDIDGLGVIIAFAAAALVSMHIILWVHMLKFKSKKLPKAVAVLVDQQMITGIAILVAGYWQLERASLYHLSLIDEFASLTQLSTIYLLLTDVSITWHQQGEFPIVNFNCIVRIIFSWIYYILYIIFTLKVAGLCNKWDEADPRHCYPLIWIVGPGGCYAGPVLFLVFTTLENFSLTLRLLGRVQPNQSLMWLVLVRAKEVLVDKVIPSVIVDRMRALKSSILNFVALVLAWILYPAMRILPMVFPTSIDFILMAVVRNTPLIVWTIISIINILNLRLASRVIIPEYKQIEKWGFGQIVPIVMLLSVLLMLLQTAFMRDREPYLPVVIENDSDSTLK